MNFVQTILNEFKLYTIHPFSEADVLSFNDIFFQNIVMCDWLSELSLSNERC